MWLQQQEANTDRQTPSRELSEGASQQGMPEGSCAERNEAAQRGCTWKLEFGSPSFKIGLQKAPGKLNLSSPTFSITEFVCVCVREIISKMQRREKGRRVR